MKTKPIHKVLTILVLSVCSTICFASTPATLDDLRGIDRIDNTRGAYVGTAINSGGTGSAYYGFRFGETSISHNGYTMVGWLKHCGDLYFPPESSVPRTITGDIREAILDQRRFDLALAEDRFFDAWSMGRDTEQGYLWKRLAINKTRERIGQLAMRSVLEDNHAKLAEAHGISSSFPEPILGELSAFIQAEITSARAVHAGLAPDIASRLTALRTISDRLFG